MLLLKQSTAVDIAIGPFLDETDGKTAETALTISQADVRLKKNNGNWAQVNDSTSASHEENGWYEKELDATDTNTLGILKVAIHESGALPVWHDFMVVPAEVYDAFALGSGNGIRADLRAIAAGIITAASLNADTDIYAAKVWMTDDNGGTTDGYSVVWKKNGQPVLSGITSPTIQVIKASDGSDLIASTAMTQIGSTGLYKYDATGAARVTSGARYFAKVTATIDGSTRTEVQPISRDSA
jgi:hypothetical protein